MKSLLITSLLFFSCFISGQDDTKEIELNVGFDTPRIVVELDSKTKYVPIRFVYDEEQLKNNNLDGYLFEVKVNEEETDIADKFFDLY